VLAGMTTMRGFHSRVCADGHHRLAFNRGIKVDVRGVSTATVPGVALTCRPI